MALYKSLTYLLTCKVFADVTSYGRLFHVFAAAIVKALSPIVPDLGLIISLYRAELMVQPMIVDRGFECQPGRLVSPVHGSLVH